MDGPSINVPPMSQSAPSALGKGSVRRVGVEIEFGGIDTSVTARIVRDTLGGSVEQFASHTATIRDTEIGDVKVELDWSWIRQSDDDGGVIDQTKELLAELGRDVVPTEIVTPPLPGERIDALDRLMTALAAGGAKGTRSGLLNGFGLHLNPELWEADLNARSLRRVIQAYLLLSPGLRRDIQVDITRTILPFVAPFGDDYLRHMLRPDYDPDLDRLIDDYIAFNPTRNRELDMLPVFAHLDGDRVRRSLKDPKIASRPTFHWRLPNADLENPDWSIAHEWERWLSVEALAVDTDRLTREIEAWTAKQARPWLERI